MRDIARGLAYFHRIGLVHLHLEPKHVLIWVKESELRAKLSNLGFTTRVGKEQSLFIDHGFEIRGWYHPMERVQPPYIEIEAMDIFALGCILFYCITGGKHPYGENPVRDANILGGKDMLLMINTMPEAHCLISRLLNPVPIMRPRASEVVCHPMFWDSDTRLQFLSDASDRFEKEKKGSTMLQELENTRLDIWQGTWDSLFTDPTFIPELASVRKYDHNKVQHLLRFVRNKHHHYEDFPQPVKTLIGGCPKGLDSYFSALFPKLLINVHSVIHKNYRMEEKFKKYF